MGPGSRGVEGKNGKNKNFSYRYGAHTPKPVNERISIYFVGSDFKMKL